MSHTAARFVVLVGVCGMACEASTPGGAAPGGGSSSGDEAPELTRLPKTLVLVDDVEAAVRDLPEVRKAGILRVLVHQLTASDVPRPGSTEAMDRQTAQELADELRVGLQLVAVGERSALLPALLEGKGDLLLDPVEAGPMASMVEPGIVVTTAVRHVDLLVVGPKAPAKKSDKKKLPRSLKDAAGESFWVQASSPANVELARKLPKAGRTAAPEALDAGEMLAAIGAGEQPLGVFPSDAVADYLTYADDVEALFPLRQGIPVGFVLRGQATQLLEAVNGHVYERAMTKHREARHAGDLADIQKRRVLRVAMLNNAASYFIYRGQEVGFQYELAELLAARLSVRLQVVVPDNPGELARLVTEGLVDLAPLPPDARDPEDAALVAFSEPFATASHVLVQRASDTPLARLEELAGKVVHIRPSSSSHAVAVAAAEKAGAKLQLVSEELETEELIDKVGRGELAYTVANSILLDAETTWRDDVVGTLVLAENQPLAYAMRPDAKALKQRVDRFLAKERESGRLAQLHDKYFKDKKRMAELRAGESSTSGAISPYDPIVRRYGQQYGIDWRLVLAQMYQESRFDPQARSWVGAVGLMQIMPRTGKELGMKNLADPEENVHAGVKYLARLVGRLEPRIPMRQRVRFALAGYNAGLDHVLDARRLAKTQGLDPDAWFGNVEQAMLLLEKPRYFRKARRGFCRGREPVAYVSRIQSKYDAYVALMPADGPAQ